MISIIVPVYNVGLYLDECLESICAQTYRDIEILLVNDGSTDNSGELCAAWAEKDPRIVLINQENQGISVVRNVGVSRAKGDYLYFVDSDDYIETNLCERVMEAFEKTDADMVMFDAYRFNKSGVFGELVNPRETRMTGRDALRALMSGTIRDYVWNKVCKRSLYDGVLFPVGQCYEDLGTIYKLFINAESIVFIPEKLYHYRRREGSILANMNDAVLADIFLMRKKRYEEVRAIDSEIAECDFEQLGVSALRFYDRSLWCDVNKEVLSSALAFLEENSRHLLTVARDKWLKLYLRSPKLYVLCRRAKHYAGNIVKAIKKSK